MKKNYAAILLTAVIMIISVAGCGSADGINASNSAEDIMARALELNNSVDSLEASIKGKMVMGTQGMDMTTDIGMDMICFNSPEKLKMDMSTSMYGATTELTSYVQKTDAGYETYMQDDNGSWTKEVLPLSEYDQIADAMGMDATTYAAGMIDLNKDGKEKLDGINTVKISGYLSSDLINTVMSAANMGEDFDELYGMDGFSLEFTGDIAVTTWIEIRTGYILRMDMDLTEVMQNYMDSLMGFMADAYGMDASELLVDISEYSMEMLYFNYNSAEDFDIPSEALSAE